MRRIADEEKGLIRLFEATLWKMTCMKFVSGQAAMCVCVCVCEQACQRFECQDF